MSFDQLNGAEKRLYPNRGLKTPQGEYRSTLVETVKEIFGEPRRK